jgi:hypothetical protein
MPIIFMIVTLIYMIMLGAFLIYKSKAEKNARLRQETIASCLGSGGHIGPGHSCWYSRPITPTVPLEYIH